MRAIVMSTALLLAGCGGGGGSGGGGSAGSGIDPRLARIDIYEAQRLRVLGDPGAGAMGMAPTDDINVPDMGAVDFNGSISIRAETTPFPAVLAGDALVTMDFEGGDVSGTFDRFFGTGTDDEFRGYAGSLDITGGSIGGVEANAWTLDYAGGLNAAGQVIAMDGTITGSFLGNPVAAIVGAELEAQLTYDGNATDAVITVVAEGNL